MMVQCKTPNVEVGRTSVAVTAVAILDNDTVIAAHSSYLVNLESKERLKLFKHQAIHLLHVSTPSVLVCGGRSISIVHLSDQNIMKISVPERRLQDWIISAQWTSNASCIAALFSYNSVALLDNTLNTIRRVECESCCIIYGGCLVEEKDSELVCCSGTVFNKPLLWKPLVDSKVIMSYSGHSGVIFDIKITDKRLYSVSDDRTLIVWDRLSGDIVHKLYGHTARVLKVFLMPSCGSVVSVGEDNQCILWSPESGEKITSFTPHSGNGIRSVICKGRTIVTGGWDSSVVKYTLSHPKPCTSHPKPCTLQQGSTEAQPKWVSWWRNTQLLVHLASGELRAYDKTLEQYEVIIPAAESRFKDYSIHCTVGDLTVMGGITGEICLLDYKTRACKYCWVNKSKIFSLTAVTCYTNRNHGNMFLSCQLDGFLTLWSTQSQSSATAVSHFTLPTPVSHFTLPKCKTRWVTSASLIEDESGVFLVVGDRKGGVHLFEVDQNKSAGEAHSPLCSIPGLHGINGISQVMQVQGRVVTVGRDGNLRFFKIEDRSLVIVKKQKPMSAVSWIEKLVKMDGQTVMYYFRGQRFEVTVLETGDTVFSVECGGGNRSWDILLSDNTLHFAYINNSHVKTVEQPLSFNTFKRYGAVSHGAEIHSAVYTGSDVIVTASEDCTLIAHSAHSASQISSHISSVRCVCVSDCGIVFSAGGRGSLKAWRVCGDRTDLELKSDYTVVSNSHIPVGYCNAGYRFDKRNTDNDQRVMSVDCCMSRDPQFLCNVACGLSNGYVYLLGYTSSNEFVRLLSDYQTNCITRVKLVGACPEAGHSLLILSSTTFGMVHGLNVSDQSVIHSRFSNQLHSSGINGLDIKLESSPQILTIGDDGDVMISKVSADSSSIKQVARRTTHFSAGIAARFLNSDRVITVGSDQRLFILDLDLNPLYCCYVDVPDLHDLVTSPDHNNSPGLVKVLVCGKGFQEFKVSSM